MNRKDEHVELALKHHGTQKVSDFDDVHFVYNALPKVDVEDVSLESTFGKITLKTPFYINAMTGGSAKTRDINDMLSQVASRTNIAIASGSISAALKDSDHIPSFEIMRSNNPNGLVFANIGAEYSLEKAKEAISIVQADVLQIHINILQEIVMPEGDRKFKHWKDNIKEIVSGVDIPVIVKEVGSGMSRQTIKELKSLGVVYIDVSGSGGTNFTQIENDRREKKEYAYLQSFGQSTVISLLEAQGYVDNTNILASGGIRNPLDIVKALALGAKAVGMSGLILNSVMNDGVEETVKMIEDWKYEIKSILTILGCSTINDLRSCDLVILGSTKEWAELRNIDIKALASRS